MATVTPSLSALEEQIETKTNAIVRLIREDLKSSLVTWSRIIPLIQSTFGQKNHVPSSIQILEAVFIAVQQEIDSSFKEIHSHFNELLKAFLVACPSSSLTLCSTTSPTTLLVPSSFSTTTITTTTSALAESSAFSSSSLSTTISSQCPSTSSPSFAAVDVALALAPALVDDTIAPPLPKDTIVADTAITPPVPKETVTAPIAIAPIAMESDSNSNSNSDSEDDDSLDEIEESQDLAPRTYTSTSASTSTSILSYTTKRGSTRGRGYVRGRGRARGSARGSSRGSTRGVRYRGGRSTSNGRTTTASTTTTSLQKMPSLDSKLVSLMIPEAMRCATQQNHPFYYRPSVPSSVPLTSLSMVPLEQRSNCVECSCSSLSELFAPFACFLCQVSLCEEHAREHNMVCYSCWLRITCFNCYQSSRAKNQLKKNVEIGTIRCDGEGCSNLLCYLDKASDPYCHACESVSSSSPSFASFATATAAFAAVALPKKRKRNELRE
jgi:hypothetical protein